MASIFTKIIQREISGYIVAEDEHHIAFLDVFPTAKGHTLVVPKQEIDKLFDLSPNAYAQLMGFTYKVSKALQQAIDCNRVGMAVIGLEVPHAHVHLIPMGSMADMDFTQPKLQLTSDEFISIQHKIQAKFEN